MVSPQIRHHRMCLLKFPVTCLGSISNKAIKFRNISSVKSMVVSEVSQPPYDERPVFWLTATPNNEHIIVLGNNG